MQKKLTAIQVSEVRKALQSLENTIHLLSETVIGVGGRMYKLETHLRNVCEHGTTDGKPWVEPEPPIPNGFRRVTADEWKRTDVMVWSYRTDEWEMRLIQGSKFDPPGGRSIYIVPIDPPLTDQDACVVPRLLVMVRDHESDGWFGPYKYLGKSKHGYAVDPDNSGLSPLWSQARRATPQEIKQAGLDRPENPAKVEPCRGHDQ